MGKPNKDKKDKDDKKVDKLTETEKQQLLSNDKDPFDLNDFNKKFKDMKIDFDKKDE